MVLLISSFSLPLAVSKLVSARMAAGQVKAAYKIFKCTLLFALVSGGIGALLIFFGAGFFSDVLVNTPESRLALQVLAPTILVVAIMGCLRGYFQGLGTMVPTAVSQIVEQVVRQVRIRVMPETTSMELRLNPASLGRVNITVAASAGIATATMVVENQMAKEALESQMIHLKEAFNEQGLKVDEVEVTVAEFGLKKDGEGEEQTGSKQSGNRKFRPNESFSDEEKNEDLTTASERRDVNSMVDYTA